MRFHQIFSSYPYIHRDKYLFRSSKINLFKSPLQNWYILGNILINPSISFLHALHLLFSVHDLHSVLLKFPGALSTNSDNEVDINVKLSINLSLYTIVLPSHFFLFGAEKVIYFLYIFPYTISSPLNSSANWLITKWVS